MLPLVHAPPPLGGGGCNGGCGSSVPALPAHCPALFDAHAAQSPMDPSGPSPAPVPSCSKPSWRHSRRAALALWRPTPTTAQAGSSSASACACGPLPAAGDAVHSAVCVYASMCMPIRLCACVLRRVHCAAAHPPPPLTATEVSCNDCHCTCHPPTPRRNWQRGTCTRADACPYKHEGPPGVLKEVRLRAAAGQLPSSRRA
jgi:hypothetical protein